MENHGKRAIHAWYVEYFTLKRTEAKRIRDDAAGEARRNTWQQESPFREIL